METRCKFWPTIDPREDKQSESTLLQAPKWAAAEPGIEIVQCCVASLALAGNDHRHHEDHVIGMHRLEN